MMPVPLGALRHSGEARWAIGGAATAGAAGASGAVGHTSRSKSERRTSRATTAGIAGAAAGQGLYQAPAYAHQRYQDAHTPRYQQVGVKQSELPKHLKAFRRQHTSERVAWKKEAKERGLNNATAHRIYPKHWPHARANRAFGWTHAGKTGQALGASATALGAAAGVRASHRRSDREMSKKLIAGVRRGYTTRHGMREGAGLIAGAALSTPPRAALAGGGLGIGGATLAARNAQNRRLRREHLPKRDRGSATIGKRVSGGSFESGPSSMVRGGHRTIVRRGRSSSFGQGSSRGTRLQEYHGKSNQRTSVRVSKAIPGAVRSFGRDAKLGVAMGRDRRAGTLIPAGNTLRPGARVGNALGSAIATPSRAAATTAGVFGGGLAARKISKMEPLYTPTNLLSRQKAAGKLVPQLNPVRSATPTAQAPTGRPATGAKAGGAGGQKAAGQPVASLGTTSSVGAMGGMKTSSGTHSVTKAADDGTIRVRVRSSRPRQYDPEAGRQRRLGGAIALTGAGGAAGLGHAVAHTAAINRNRKATTVLVNRRAAGAGAAGLAGLAVSHRLAQHARDPRNRRWS